MKGEGKRMILHNRAVGLASHRVGRVVDAGRAQADRHREGRLVRRHRHLVQHDRLEVLRCKRMRCQ